MLSNSKRGYEFSFAWIFTIFIGAAVIFFAIYLATQIVGTKQVERDSAEGKSIGILLTPIETQTEQSKFSKILLTDETTLYTNCEAPTSDDPFGSQLLSTSVKSPLGNPEISGIEITFHNKYLFPSSSTTTGKDEIYVLSKPLFLPFKVADLLIVWSDQEKFCFYDAPTDLKKELSDLKLANVFIQSTSTPCDNTNQQVVCFNIADSSRCDIIVDQNQHKVSKSGGNSYYIDPVSDDKFSMMLAAIFSSPENYNCQIRRLMAHTSNLVNIYYEKSQRIQSKTSSGCSQSIQSDLLSFKQTTDTIAQDKSSDVSRKLITENVDEKASLLKITNGGMSCALF